MIAMVACSLLRAGSVSVEWSEIGSGDVTISETTATEISETTVSTNNYE
jgi:hypothetical protein